MMSQTGGFVTMVTGRGYVKSNKQKLNTKSSAEAEFVGMDNVLSCSHGHKTTSLAHHILVHHKCCINVTLLYFRNCLLTWSMVGQLCLSFTPLHLLDYFNHQCQVLSILLIITILTILCLRTHALTCVVAGPQNDEKGLRQFGIVWSHLLKYQKFGLRQVLLITPLCLMVCHRAYLQYSRPYIILICLERISWWSSWGICVSYPMWWSFSKYFYITRQCQQ